MKRFLTSGALISVMLLGFLVVSSPPSPALAASVGKQSRAIASVAFKASVCVQWINETGCNTGVPHRAGTSIFITASVRPAPVAPWRLVMMTKETTPNQVSTRVQVDCGQRVQCQVSGPASGPGTASFWSCVTDRSTNLAEVCSKAGPHAVLSDYAWVIVS